MSDRKHIEYCIRLGNTLVGNAEDYDMSQFDQEKNNYSGWSNNEDQMGVVNNIVKPKRSQDMLDFRARLQNWK